jgi:molybdopterin-guanine dinucleotide biosynthesis protein A
VRCSGLLLTGGASRRLGRDKATLRVGGETLAERAARVLSLACSPVLEVGPGVSGLPAVREDPAGAGPLTALAAGGAALADRDVGGPVVVLGVDQVRVEVPLLRLLVRWPGRSTVLPVAGGRLQTVCARWAPDALHEAQARRAAGERSLRWVADLPGTVVLPEAVWRAVAPFDAFDDVDTPADAVRLGVSPG